MRFFLVIVIMIFSPHIFAEQRNWYLGVVLNQQDYQDTDNGPGTDFKDFGFIFGKNINDNLSLEARYGEGIDKGNITSTIDLEIDYYISFYAKGIISTKYSDFYALAGYTKSKLNSSSGSSDDADSMSYGVGVSYNITDRFSIFTEYKQLVESESANYKINGYGVGLNYSF
jgi:outer membrane autotransporter protein